MAIFGLNSAKFVVSSTTVLLDYMVILKNEPDYRYLEHESEIDGTRYYSKKGKHWAVELKVHLFKYGDLATIKSKFNEIYAYEGDECTLYLHRDGPAFKDSSDVVVPFVLKEIVPIYIETSDFKDGLILKFESTKFVDLSVSAAAAYQLAEITMSNDF